MRSEHSTTGDEWDITSGWFKVMCSYTRAGRKKAVKRQSHRLDRAAKQRKLLHWQEEYEDRTPVPCPWSNVAEEPPFQACTC